MSATKWNKTSENISVSLPSSLIEIMDNYCEENDSTRASLVKRALKKYLASKRAESMSFWHKEYQRIHKK